MCGAGDAGNVLPGNFSFFKAVGARVMAATAGN